MTMKLSLERIQQDIETAIHKFSGQKVTIQGAGRTDAGVHAYGQIFHVDFVPFSKPMTPFEIAKAINAYLRPAPIAILNAEVADKEGRKRGVAAEVEILGGHFASRKTNRRKSIEAAG